MTPDQFIQDLRRLSGRARRFGSRAPDDAVQEAVRRALADAHVGPVLRFFFDRDTAAPEPVGWDLGRIQAWLTGVVHNVVREERRHDARQLQVEEATFEQPGNAQDPLDLVVHADLIAVMQAGLKELPPDMRQALRMRLKGATQEQIAVAMGRPQTTINNWLHRGLTRLARHFRERTDRDSGPKDPSA